MERYEMKREILAEINAQIGKMDTKAGLLVSVIGIVFAVSADLLLVYSIDNFLNLLPVFVFFCFFITNLYYASFVFTIVMFILTIVPRKNTRQKKLYEERFYFNYYKDISGIASNKERLKILNDSLSTPALIESNIENQIFTNAETCSKKHRFLFLGIIGLSIFVVSLVGLILLFIIGNVLF